MPRIANEVLDGIFFLYRSLDDAQKSTKFGGTGFVLSFPSETIPEITYFYGVTNWHVAVRDGFSVVRVNTTDGGTDILEYGPEDWLFDADGDDLAVIQLNPNFATHSLKPIPAALIYKKEVLLDPSQFNIGLGDDVFMLGRFVEKDYGPMNTPTARFGCISAMPSPVEQSGPRKGLKDSYCLDMHSRSGYSGSPVFVYRTPGTNLEHTIRTGSPDLGRSMLCLLGVHFGQFSEELKAIGDQEQLLYGPSGMTCAVPSWKILELLDKNELKQERARSDAIWTERIRNEQLGPADNSTEA